MIRDILLNTTEGNNNTDSGTDSTIVPVSAPAQVVFYVFLLLDIPSVLCSLLLLFYFIRLPELRHQHESNQIIIYLLIGSLLVTAIDIPLILPYLQNYYYITLMTYSNSFCIFWIMYDYGMYSLNLWLMALACLERYLRIFFKEIITKNNQRRFFLYYVSVTTITLFVIVWYLYLVALYPCAQTQFDLTQIVCGFPCYKTVGSVTVQNTDWALADLLPLFLSILFIFVLISHVLYQRYKTSKRLMQPNTWRRTRKMFLQLLPITVIFLVFNLPLIIVGLLAISNPWYNTTSYFYANSLSYFLSLFMPFAVLSRQTVIRKRLSTLLKLERWHRIAPGITMAVPMRLMNTQTAKKTGVGTAMNDGI